MLKITINNWENYNARKDRANYTWFRFENQFFSDPEIFELTDSQKILFIYIICESSKKNNATIKFSEKQAASVLNSTTKKIVNDLASLSGLVSCSRHDDGKSPGVSLATDIQTDNTYKQTNISAPAAQDSDYSTQFLECWKEYPLKKGKQEAYKAWKKIPDKDGMKKSCSSYFRECELKGTRPQYMKHMSSFLNSGRWKDYHDPEAQKQIVEEVENQNSVNPHLWKMLERGEL